MGWDSTNSEIEFRLEGITMGTLLTGTLTHDGTTWCHICGVCSVTNGWTRLFVNGKPHVLSLTNGSSQTYTGVDYLTIGARSNPALTEYSNMDLPIVMIHNKTLFPVDVEQNYNAHKSRFGL